MGTIIFAIPRIALTNSAITTAQQDGEVATDYCGAAETARELAVVCPEFKRYSIGMEATAGTRDGGRAEGSAERLVARVTTSEPLTGDKRTIAKEPIRLDALDVEHVEFSVG